MPGPESENPRTFSGAGVSSEPGVVSRATLSRTCRRGNKKYDDDKNERRKDDVHDGDVVARNTRDSGPRRTVCGGVGRELVAALRHG